MEALLFVSLVLSIFPLIALPFAGFFRIRRKGYRAPGATLVIIVATTLGILSAFLVSRVLPWDGGDLRRISVVLWLPLLVATLATTLFIRFGPRRNPRVAGRRRPHFPLAASGWTLIGFSAALCVFTVVWWAMGNVTVDKSDPDSDPISKSVELFAICSAFGGFLLAVSRRVKAQVSLQEVSRKDPRTPVLYLRPFGKEWLPFVTGRRSRYGDYVHGLQQWTMTLGQTLASTDPRFEEDPLVTVTFEQYLAGAITARIGPFFALGNPEDYIPREGAIRTYVEDRDWKRHVERLAAESSCIVAEVAASSNLRWELEYLRRHGLQQKLFVMTRPVLASPKRFERLILWLRGTHLETWREFAESLASLGYDLPNEPVAGAVITFDASGKASILTTGAEFPDDYVEPIRSVLISSLRYSAEQLEPAPAVPTTPREVRPTAIGSALDSAWRVVRSAFLLYEPGRLRAWIPYGICWLAALFLLGAFATWTEQKGDASPYAAFVRNLKSPEAYSPIQLLLSIYLLFRLWGGWERKRETASRTSTSRQPGAWASMLACFYVLVGVVTAVGVIPAGIVSLSSGIRWAIIAALLGLCALPFSQWEKLSGKSYVLGRFKMKRAVALSAPAMLLCGLALFNFGGVVRDEFPHSVQAYWENCLLQPVLPFGLLLLAAPPIIGIAGSLSERHLRWFVPSALLVLVPCYFCGVLWWQDVITTGYAHAAAADQLYRAEHYEPAVLDYERAGNAGVTEAMANLGLMYSDGQGVAQNYTRAKEWYEKAARAGDALSMNNLGVLYDQGNGVEQDYVRARQWFEKAASAGDATAMRNLGVLYERGKGVGRDYRQAKQWYEKASALGDTLAAERLRSLPQ